MSKVHVTPTMTEPALDAKAVRTLAQSIHRDMRDAGYSSGQVVDFASTIVDLVRDQYRGELDRESSDELAAE